MHGKKKSKKGILIIIFLGMVLLTGILISLAMWSAERAEREELDARLRASEMELSLRNTAGTQKQFQAQHRQLAYADELSKRQQLDAALRERDAADLMTLVNPWNAVPADWNPRLVSIGNGMTFDERGAAALKQMVADCKAAGNKPVAISAYRTQETQQELFDNKVLRVIEAGTNPAFAEAEAAMSVAIPGTSEHQLGFSVDIVDNARPDLDFGQQWTPTQRWLMEHCTDYGFILRYPVESTDVTGIIFEPWHYRYVGVKNAKKIAASALVFEQYLEQNS